MAKLGLVLISSSALAGEEIFYGRKQGLDLATAKKSTPESEVVAATQEVNRIQVNFCKNPLCRNFNVPFTGLR